ncbi:MAG: alpha/beta fold hydrolase [Opitutales bacterium]|nr:alpha/beta fold hydrolase [Opitutales bacterium]
MIEKNLWQRLPVRWRVIFLFLALVGASYGVRNWFPMMPDLRDGQAYAEVDELSVESVWETPEEARAAASGAGKNLPEIPQKTARLNGFYVSKLLPTGQKIKIAYSEFSPENVEMPASPAVPAPASAENKSALETAKENGRELYDSSKRAVMEAWKNWRDGEADRVPVLLLHGAARDGTSLEAVAREIVRTGAAPRVIVPDLPGAGASQREVADYSIQAAAGEMFELLNALGIEKVNVLGFGQGGGAAIYMAHLAPERVKSLALISSTGAQEFELLGNHIVNKIVYTFLLGFFKLAQDVLPHFGLMDAGNVNKAFARMLWDSDMSDLKQFLRDWQGPLFLAHGNDDIVTPAVAAEYSAKLAPQAQTHFVPGGHHVFLENPVALADSYAAFLGRVAVPAEAKKLSRAEPVPATEVFPPIEAAHGVRVLVLMLVILVCTFVAEDPTCLASGLLVAQGLIEFIPATIACLVGIFIGDSVLYLIGRFLGRPVLRKAPFKWIISEQEVDRMSDWFDKNPKGFALIISSRFIPGSRVPTFVAAGIMKLNMVKLIMLFFIAAAVWTPPLILLAEKVGAGVIDKFKEWHHNAAWIVIGAILGLWLLTHYVIPAFTWRGRRRHVMMRRQWTRHEFWPHFILTIPLMLHYLWQSVIHRSFTLFTLANRGLGADGGLPSGSKFEHYTKFLSDKTNPEVAAVYVKTALVPVNENLDARTEDVLALMRENEIAFPCVMKPEIGDGGVGVCIVRSREHLRNWLEVNPDSAMVQEFVGGNEYEIIWSRRPGRTDGRIQTVVEKDFVIVKGDGERKLEDLIWAGDKSVSNGKLFSKINFREANRVLEAGEPYALAPIGSRIKGANFVSRPELRAGTLADVIDRLADACGDVHYLVLDVRAESDADLADGKNIRITGVKGAGATAGTIFDGYVRMGMAYSRAFRQMNYCFGIGAEVRDEQGVNPEISAFRLFEMWGTARGRSDNYVKLPHDEDS